MVTLLYAGSTLFHIIALYYGLMCVKHGEALFTRSSPRDILTSRIEQKYWTVILGILSNLLLLAVMPMYMLSPHFDAITWLNYPFAVFHILDGFITALWHWFTLQEIKSGRLARYDRATR